MKISTIAALMISATVLLTACGFDSNRFNNTAPTPTPAAPRPPEDSSQKLDSLQKQGFTFIYKFRRKDAGKLDAEDKKFLRANAPVETNQWIVTDEGATAIAGSNYLFPPVNLDNLRTRFEVEDLSPPPAASDANVNAGAGNAANR